MMCSIEGLFVSVSVSGGQSWVERYRVSLQTLVGRTERLRQTCKN